MPHMIAGVTAPPRWQWSSASGTFRESGRAIGRRIPDAATVERPAPERRRQPLRAAGSWTAAGTAGRQRPAAARRRPASARKRPPARPGAGSSRDRPTGRARCWPSRRGTRCEPGARSRGSDRPAPSRVSSQWCRRARPAAGHLVPIRVPGRPARSANAFATSRRVGRRSPPGRSSIGPIAGVRPVRIGPGRRDRIHAGGPRAAYRRGEGHEWDGASRIIELPTTGSGSAASGPGARRTSEASSTWAPAENRTPRPVARGSRSDGVVQ